MGASWVVLGRFWCRLGAVLGRSWAVLGVSWGSLGASWRPLGGQNPPETRAIRVLGPQETRLGLIFDRFLGMFLNGFLILFLPYPEIPKHVVKPKKYYFCSTGEPLEAFQVHYF